MTRKARPNDPCTCGSGLKYKRCCGSEGAREAAQAAPHTPADRAAAFEALDFFVHELWGVEEREATEWFWGDQIDRAHELPEGLASMSRAVQEVWFAFDYPIDGGRPVVDAFLEQAELSPGQRAFLTAMRNSSMRLYEVTATVPGTSMTLRDLMEGTTVTVRERSASRTIPRRECIAARVIPRGCSGQPEIEAGVLHIPALMRDPLLTIAREHRDRFIAEEGSRLAHLFYKELPPIVHAAWVEGIFDPAIPRLSNTDGEELLITRVTFRVDDEAALCRALDEAGGEGIEPEAPGTWHWVGAGGSGDGVQLGRLEIADGLLTIETNAAQRGARIRALIERLAGSAVSYQLTTYEDVRRRVAEGLTAEVLGVRGAPKKAAPEMEGAAEAVLQFYDRHYRAWIDQPVPALDGLTPRAAARRAKLRSRVVDLIDGLERRYEDAVKAGEPAYDPSWMWAELGLPRRGE